MVNWTVVIGPIIGGFISGLVGLAIAEYRFKKSEERELESWYDKTIRLTERIENSQPLTLEAGEAMEQAPIIRNTCAGVHTALANHLSEAPSDVNSELIEDCEKLVGDCQIVKDHRVNGPDWELPHDFFEDARNAKEQASIVKKKATSERQTL